MENTPVQQQIEYLVTNGLGYPNLTRGCKDRSEVSGIDVQIALARMEARSTYDVEKIAFFNEQAIYLNQMKYLKWGLADLQHGESH